MNLLVVEDDPLMISELRMLFAGRPEYKRARFATSCREAQAYSAQSFDVLLLDLQLPDGSGLDLVAPFRAIKPSLVVLVFTVAADKNSTLRAMELGVNGYVLKDDPDIVGQVSAALQGHAPIDRRVTPHLVAKLARRDLSHTVRLSAREQQTLDGLYHGLSYEAIANRMRVSPKTVPNYIKSLYKKLSVSSRSQAVYRGLELELLQP